MKRNLSKKKKENKKDDERNRAENDEINERWKGKPGIFKKMTLWTLLRAS